MLRARLWLTLALCGCSTTIDGQMPVDAGAESAVDAPGLDGAADVRTDGQGSDPLLDVPSECVLPLGGRCPVGSECPAGDGCNTCRCGPGGVASCTRIGCVDAGRDADPADAPRPDAGPPCLSNADCGARQFCTGPFGCAVPWHCAPLMGCTADLATMCACDGTTIMGSSSCPGRPVRAFGPCTPPPPCVLSNGTMCPVGRTCPAGDGCNDCTCTGAGMLVCTARPCAFDAGPPPMTCSSSRDCPAGTECVGDAGCAVPWTCRATMGRACTEDLAPYCSCAGTTVFGSSSCPPVPYRSRGPCPDAG